MGDSIFVNTLKICLAICACQWAKSHILLSTIPSLPTLYVYFFITNTICHCNLNSLVFDLMTLKSNQFIASARYIHVFSLIVIRLLVPMIMRSNVIFAYIMSEVYEL